MKDEIGQMAGAIWHGLNTHGELSIARLKKLVEGEHQSSSRIETRSAN